MRFDMARRLRPEQNEVDPSPVVHTRCSNVRAIRSAPPRERATSLLVGELPIRHLEPLHGWLDAWAMLWDVPLLAKSVRIRTNARYRRSLGAYHPTRSQITLATWLLDDGTGESPHPLLREVVCHEAAHAAVHLSVGGSGSVGVGRGLRGGLRAVLGIGRGRRERLRPHGPEWRAFMIAAGLEPRVRIPEGLMPEAVRAKNAAGKRWEHRCLECQAVRMARIRMTRWRCRRCVEAGGSGRLGIRWVESPMVIDR
jgi:predicted SprT family Zn-dependent metalloprotease